MKFSTKIILSIFAAFLLLQGCDENTTGPDLNELAPPPYDQSQAVRDTTINGGVEIYVIEEGTGTFDVVARDQLLVRYTGRTADGEVFFTTYRENDLSNNLGSMLNLTPNVLGNTPPLIEGLRKAVIGMHEGERRSIVVPPSMGYNTPPGRFAPCNPSPCTNGMDLRDRTVVFDVELVTIQQ